MRFLILFISSIFLFLQSCSHMSADLAERKVYLSDSTSFYTISVEYPEDKRDVDDVMKNFVLERFESKKKEWAIGGEAYKEEEAITRAFPERANVQYSYGIEFEKVKSDSLKTVSYIFTTYEYTGGANGNTWVNTFNFSGDKRQLKIEDILSFDNYQDIRLSELLAEAALNDTTLFFKDFVMQGLGLNYLKSDGKSIDHQKCQCDGYFYGSNLQNFVIKDRGLEFYFDKYAIAPGAHGISQIFLSWEQLKPYFKEGFKL